MTSHRFQFGARFVLSALLFLGFLGGLFSLERISVEAAFPRVLPFSAKLRSTSTETAVPDGNYSIVFKIYDAETGGSALWSETQMVAVKNGSMSADLGTVTPLPTTLTFNDGNYYLGITVGSDAEMSPRRVITAVPLALNSASVDGLTPGMGANNILKLDGSGGVNIAGPIVTAGELQGSGATISGALSSSSLSVSGAASVGGNLTISGNLVPSVAGSFDLGTSSNPFNSAYINNLVVGTTSTSGTSNSSFTINQLATGDEDSALNFYRGGSLASAQILWNASLDQFDLNQNVRIQGNVGVGSASDFSGGTGVLSLTDATVLPSGNPVDGGVLYSNGGDAYWLGSTGSASLLQTQALADTRYAQLAAENIFTANQTIDSPAGRALTLTSPNTEALLVNSRGTNALAGNSAFFIRSTLNAANANAVATVIRVRRDENFAAAAGLGSRISWDLRSSTTSGREAAAMDVLWTDATDASRTSAIAFSVVNNAGALSEILRLQAGAGGGSITTGAPITSANGFTVGSPTRQAIINSGGISLQPSSRYGWGASDAGGATDTNLYRDAANMLALRTGTNAQTFRIYNTYTDGSNFERLGIGWSSNVLKIDAEKAGTGTQRNIALQSAGGNVGIGTTNPNALLDIVGSDNSSLLKLSYSLNVSDYSLMVRNPVPTGGVVSYNFDVKNAGTLYSNVLVLNKGSVGIGVATPSAKLDVAGNIYSSNPATDTIFNGNQNTGSANFVGASGYWALRTATNNSYNLDTYNSGTPITAMTVLQNGSIGVGTANPQAGLAVVSGKSTVFSVESGAANVRDIEVTSAGNITIGYTYLPTDGYVLRVNRTGNGQVLVGILSDIKFTKSSGPTWPTTPASLLIDSANNQLISQGWDGTNAFKRFGYGNSNYIAFNGNGNAGIGTVTPGSKLEVVGTAKFSGGAPFSSIEVTKTAANNAVLQGNNLSGEAFRFTSDSGAGIGWKLGSGGSGSGGVASDNFYITQASTTDYNSSLANRFTILQASGNVGIGTATPGTRLDVQAATNPEIRVKAIGGTATVSIDSTTESYLQFRRNGVTGFSLEGISTGFGIYNAPLGAYALRVLESNNNVGIGLTDPTAKLHVVGSSDTQQLVVKANAAQTANIVEVQDANGNVLASVNNNGQVKASNFAPALATKTADYTITAKDGVIRADASSDPFTVTLPSVAGITGTTYTIKKVDASANVVTVAANSSELIDGGTTAALSAQYDYLTVISNGAGWDIIGQN